LPIELPVRPIAPAKRDPELEKRSRLRTRLAAAGANEVLTYTFVHGKLLDAVGQDRDLAFQLRNALSPDLQYYRLSLTPSLLEKIHPNLKSGTVWTDENEFALFEINKTHSKSALGTDGLPVEFGRLALVFAADDKTAQRKYAGAPYYQAVQYLDRILPYRPGRYSFEPLDGYDFGDNLPARQLSRPFEPRRAAAVVAYGQFIGVVGEYRQAVKKTLKLPPFTAGFEVDIQELPDQLEEPYAPLPKFPVVQQDLSLKMPASVPFAELERALLAGLSQILPESIRAALRQVDIYQSENNSDYRHITFRITLLSYERTLQAPEVNAWLDQLAASAGTQFNAERL
jgi:phenylalanyl-tRNA synthetase beta chain